MRQKILKVPPEVFVFTVNSFSVEQLQGLRFPLQLILR